jgi:TolB-like protein
MASLLPEYEYDIFISYRHNDNLDGWVSDFVQNLERELRGTLKDPVTIYFDKNPHDGLLETHSVDKSLEGKLKCLIFIPIVSQTYCDPKSFAWQYEFCAFNKLAKEDAFGRDVRVSGGNVASRILPVKIHDIDAEDKALLENELGGTLRALEFIFRSPGVNRPLTASDNPDKNQNKTFYRDQVNKTANAVKEIITALKNPANPGTPSAKSQKPIAKSNPLSSKTIAFATLAIMVLLALIYAASQFIGSSDKEPEILDKSIAVLPFADLSENKDQGWFGDGLTEEILNSLAHINGLHVTSRTSSFAFKDKNLRIQTIADSLGVNYIVEGSVRKSGDGLRITAQLIRSNDGFHIWSNTYDRESKDIFDLQKEIAAKIAESLDISLDAKALEQMHWAGTTSAEAFLAFLKGRELDDDAHRARRFIDLAKLKQANVYYEESMLLDPNFVNPYLYHADFFLHFVLHDDPHYQDTLTDKQAYRLFMNDLAKAIDHSTESSQADYYRIPQAMYSNDWTNFRSIIEKSMNSKDAAVLFKYQNFDLSTILIGLGYGDRLTEISEAIIIQEPGDLSAWRNIVLHLLHKGKYQEALDKIAGMNDSPTRLGVNDYKLFALIQLGKLDEAYNEIIRDPNQDYFAFYDLKALILAKQGNREAAKKELLVEHRSSPFYLFAVDAALGRKAANAEAARMDKELLLDFPLFRSYFLSPANLPYDLASAPNFERRLREAGALKVPTP